MVVRAHPEAVAEFGEAVAFYEERAPGLGQDLFVEVERILKNIGENPGLGSPLDGPYRKALCRRFPFAVIYRELDDSVRVQAIMHERRRPGYWKGRE